MSECFQAPVSALLMGLLLPYLAYRYAAGHRPFWSCALTWLTIAGSGLSLFGHAYLCAGADWMHALGALWLGALAGALYALHVHGVQNRFAERAAEVDTRNLLQLALPVEVTFWLATGIMALCAALLQTPALHQSQIATFCCSTLLLAAMVLAFYLYCCRARITPEGIHGWSRWGVPCFIAWTDITHIHHAGFGLAFAFRSRDQATTVYLPLALNGMAGLLERLRASLPSRAPNARLDTTIRGLVAERNGRLLPRRLA